MCCRFLAVWCRVVQRIAECCNVFQCVAICCCVLQCHTVCCGRPCSIICENKCSSRRTTKTVGSSVLLCVAVRRSVLQCIVVRCSVLQCIAVCCDVLQCVAVCCKVPQKTLLNNVRKQTSAQARHHTFSRQRKIISAHLFIDMSVCTYMHMYMYMYFCVHMNAPSLI